MKKPVTNKQEQFLFSKDKRLNLLEGSVRSGKTYISLVKWAMYVYSCPEKYEFLMAAKTITTLKRNCLNLLQSIVGEDNFSFSITNKAGYLYGRQIWLEGAGDESSMTKIRGVTLGGAYIDELTLIPRSFYNMLLTRLSEPGAKLYATTNPDTPTHWVKTDILDMQEKLDLSHWQFQLDDNTFLSREFRDNLKLEHSGVFYDRYILGQWVVAEGLIYRQFAENMEDYLITPCRENLKDVMYTSIGVDFGGNKSLTTFVATAVHTGYKKLTVIADYHIEGQKGDIDADRLCREFIGFIQRLWTDYPWIHIKYVWADSEAQYLINSLRKACHDAGLGFDITDSKKKAIIDRIYACNTLLNTRRLFLNHSCKLLQDGLRNAVWHPKMPDERLDNFTSDIDILDAFEYSWEPFMEKLCPNLKER